MSLSPVLNALRNILAVVGLTLLVAAVLIYVRGTAVMKEFDPKAAQVMGEFALKVLESDLASASVIKMPVADGVSIEDAIQSMTLRANQRNIALVSRFPMHKTIEALTGEAYPFVEIFAFCDALTAARLLQYNQDFVIHMPCRIALYEDAQGKIWLSTMNLEPLIHGARELDPELKPQVVTIKDGILDIMAAGASGDL